MDKRRNIKVIIGVIVVLAVIIQLSRIDNIFVGNFQNTNNTIDEKLINSKGITERFESDDRFALYFDGSDDMSMELLENVERILKDTKKEYDTFDVNQVSETRMGYTVNIICFEQLDKMKYLNKTLDEVATGKSLIFMTTPERSAGINRISRKLGFIEYGSPIINKGITFDGSLFPGYHEDQINTVEVENYTIPTTLSEDCKIYIRSSNKQPILWSRDIGDGRVVVYNGTMLRDKMMVGIINRIISLSKKDYVYPIINSKVVFLDDFPAPASTEYFDEIKKLYRKTIKEFYVDVWWPKMLGLAKKYDTKYTAVMISTYNDRVEPPFEDDDIINKNELIILGREIISSGGELGLHGYNHQSLTMEEWKSEELGYNKWASSKDMELALLEARRNLGEAFPKYEINTYVPPSNVISDEGIKAVKKIFPEIDVIASVFYEDYEELSYSQNFEYTGNKVINLPRFSAGYNFGESNRLAILNGVFAYGVVSHFIHPDDFMDPERNEGKTWLEQLDSYEELLKSVNQDFGYIRASTASEAASEIVKYIGLDYSVDYGSDQIEVKTNASRFPMYMEFRTEKELGLAKDCLYTPIGENEYLIEFNKPNFTIQYKR